MAVKKETSQGAKQLSLFDPEIMEVDYVLDSLDKTLREARIWPTVLAEIVDVLADFIENRKNKDPEIAMELAQDVIIVLAHHIGGRSIYLPRDDRLKRALRDAAI